MITVKLQGGLGNQMFQYAMGKVLSMEQKKELALDTTFLECRFPQKSYTFRRYELDVFGIDANFTRLSELVRRFPLLSRIIHPVIWHVGHRILFVGRYVKEDMGKHVDSFPSNAYLDGYWQDCTYFEKIRKELRESFAVAEKPSGRNAELLEQIEGSDNTVSVHIRRGDYVSNQSSNSWHGICGQEYYEKAIKRIKEKVSDPRFFVFSDEIDWVRENMSFPADTVYVDHNGAKGHEDLRIMRHCRHHIIANSSFSWWGAWLGETEGSVNIAPNKWLANEDYDTSGLIPANWIKI